MRDPIYISKHLDSIKKELIIEEDKHSIWTYLLDSENDNKIVLDGFVCSTGTVVEKSSDVKEFLDNDFAPPISENFVNEFTIQKGLNEKDFRIETDKNIVTIYIISSKFAIFDLDKLKAYSKSVSKPGPYGLPINQFI